MTNYSIRAFPVAELPVPGWECFFGRNDTSFHKLVFYVWLVESGGKRLVIDAGPPPGEEDFAYLVAACQEIDPQSTMSRVQTIEHAFVQAGVSPESVDYLLITQPITYHTGGLLPELFPRAKVFLSRAGMFEFLLDNPGHPPQAVYFTEATWHYLRSLIIARRLMLVDQMTEVLEGVYFETTGGHHPGSAAVRIRTSSGIVGILETAFLRENVEQQLPIGIAENTALCREVIRRYKRECDLLLACHDNTILTRFPGGVIA
jgi:glyoxylase-like metal-dependent hydrolase (beta-lactamase superfamily II)